MAKGPKPAFAIMKPTMLSAALLGAISSMHGKPWTARDDRIVSNKGCAKWPPNAVNQATPLPSNFALASPVFAGRPNGPLIVIQQSSCAHQHSLCGTQPASYFFTHLSDVWRQRHVLCGLLRCRRWLLCFPGVAVS